MKNAAKKKGKLLLIIISIAILAVISSLFAYSYFLAAGPLSSYSESLFGSGAIHLSSGMYAGRLEASGKDEAGTVLMEETVGFPVLPAAARSEIETKALLLDSEFLPEPSPYPGALTRSIVCPPEFIPQKYALPSGFSYRLYAGERENYGICSADLIKYNSTYSIWYCPRTLTLREARIYSTGPLLSGYAEAAGKLFDSTC